MIKRAGLLVFALPVPTLPHKTRKSGAPVIYQDVVPTGAARLMGGA